MFLKTAWTFENRFHSLSIGDFLENGTDFLRSVGLIVSIAFSGHHVLVEIMETS